jgi:hypothetical protein
MVDVLLLSLAFALLIPVLRALLIIAVYQVGK